MRLWVCCLAIGQLVWNFFRAFELLVYWNMRGCLASVSLMSAPSVAYRNFIAGVCCVIVMNNPSSLAVPDRINNILALGYLSLGGDFENLF